MGVDPGTVFTGWGVIESEGGQVRYLASGVIEAGRGEIPARLAVVYSQLCEALGRHAPDVLSLERNFLALNVQSAFRLGEARGVAMAAAAGAGVPLYEYTPAMIKKAVVGHGRADKTAVTLAVVRLLGLHTTLRADEADALAAAACHGLRSPFAAKVAAALCAGAARSKRARPKSGRDEAAPPAAAVETRALARALRNARVRRAPVVRAAK